MKLPATSGRDAKSFGSGASVSSRNASRAWTSCLARVAPGFSPPDIVIQIKALAFEFSSAAGVPLSRWSNADLAMQARRSGLVAAIGDSTVWRWLNEDAIKPWQHRCWIFPRDPLFAEKAGRALDLYQRTWQDQDLKGNKFVLSTDEKTSIQARARVRRSLPTNPGNAMKVEHEYKRCGAWAYMTALDVHHLKLFGRCERKTGITPFNRLVIQVMAEPPYKNSRRVFWIMDNGSSHRGKQCVERLTSKYPRLAVVHGPVHASWLNQIEICFSILQRRVLKPNDFNSLSDLKQRILDFQYHYESIAKPFEWKFTRRNLNEMLTKLKRAA